MAAEAQVDFIGKDEKLERTIKNIEGNVEGLGSKLKGALGAAVGLIAIDKLKEMGAAILGAARESEEFGSRMQVVDDTVRKVQLSIAGYLVPAVEWLLDAGIKTATGLQTAWQQMGDVWQVTVDTTKLAGIIWFEELKHHFTVRIPAYLTWFADNWTSIFTDIFNFTMTVNENLLTNFKGVFESILNLIQGKDADWKWVGLTEGFKASIKELPTIAAREITDVEKVLAESIAKGSGSIAGKYEKNLEANQNAFGGQDDKTKERGRMLDDGLTKIAGFFKGKSLDSIIEGSAKAAVEGVEKLKVTAGEYGAAVLGSIGGPEEKEQEKSNAGQREDVRAMIDRISNAAASNPELDAAKKTADATTKGATFAEITANGITRMEQVFRNGVTGTFG